MIIQPVGNTVLLKSYRPEVKEKSKGDIVSDEDKINAFVSEIVAIGDGEYGFFGKLLKKIGIYSKRDIIAVKGFEVGDYVTVERYAGNAFPNQEDLTDPYYLVDAKGIISKLKL